MDMLSFIHSNTHSNISDQEHLQVSPGSVLLQKEEDFGWGVEVGYLS